jgi:PAS domain S-box-containing protein
MASDRILRNSRKLGLRLGAQATSLAIALVACALLWLVLFHYLEHQTQDAIAEASETNLNLAKELSQHLLQIANDLELQTDVLAGEIERNGTRHLDLVALRNRLASALPLIDEVSVFDARGRELASSQPGSDPHPQVQEVVAHHAGDDSGALRIGAPVLWRSGGKALIPITHRLNSADGGFGGVVLIAIDPQILAGTFDTIRRAGGSITLLNSDGIVLARSAGVGDTAGVGDNLGRSAAFRQMKQKHAGVLVFNRSTDGQRRIVAFESLGRYPLIVRVGSSLDEVLISVRQHWPGYYAVAALMTIVLLATAWILARAFKRLQQATRAIAAGKRRAEDLLAENQKRLCDFRASEERFRSLLSASSDGIWMHSDGRLHYVNDTLAKTLGYDNPQDLLGREVLEFLPPEVRQRFVLRRANATGANAATPLRETQLLRRGGSHIDVEAAGACFRQDDADWFITIIRDITARNRLHSELRELAAHHETIREEERAHIARELHDQLGQMLTGVKLHLSAMGVRYAQDATYATQNAYVMRQVEHAITMTRNVVMDLRPPALDQGLSAAVAWLTERFSQRTGIICSVSAEDFKTDESQAIALFRVLQESLTNVARHAGARQVQVTLTHAGGRVRLQVTDDGSGFVTERETSGTSFGLLGIRERVAMLGGRLTIRSAPGKGTTVEVDIALEEKVN